MDKVEQIFKRYERQAKTRNLTFRITLEEFERLISQPCHYCGLYGQDGYVGLDRIWNNIGYLPSNVVPACPECNFAKRVMTKENFIRMCLRVAEQAQKNKQKQISQPVIGERESEENEKSETPSSALVAA